MSSSAALFTLSDLAVLEFQGADAISFLHAQLTQDVQHLAPHQAKLGAYCNAKGRVQATLVFWRTPDDTGIQALVKADIADALMNRLRMFVLRSKVSIERIPVHVYGYTGPSSLNGLTPPQDTPPYTLSRTPSQHLTWISAPQVAQEKRWWLISPTQIDGAHEDSAPWQIADMQAGLPWVDQSAYEGYIPQTLNLDLIDGINFQKGCYPGQEVVARSHYRGTIKRRMAYACTKAQYDLGLASAWAGQDIVQAADPDAPCGRIINAAIHEGLLHVLLEVQLVDLESAEFYARDAQGPRLYIQALPYRLTKE